MVKNSNTYFYISGLISLSLFGIFLAFFLYMLFSAKTNKSYALKKDNYISISINTDVSTKVKSRVKDEIQKEIKKPIENIEPQVEPKKEDTEDTKEIDIGDLFSEVTTKEIKKIKPKPKKRDIRKLNELQKKIKTIKNNKVESFRQKIKNIDSNNISKENSKASTGDEVNEYLAKINALVYRYFHPPQNSQGHSVKAVIELSAIGKVIDFRILHYSSNESLNSECEKIKVRLMSVVFPKNPHGKSSRTIVILTSKE
jgi:protein TonB